MPEDILLLDRNGVKSLVEHPDMLLAGGHIPPMLATEKGKQAALERLGVGPDTADSYRLLLYRGDSGVAAFQGRVTAGGFGPGSRMFVADKHLALYNADNAATSTAQSVLESLFTDTFVSMQKPGDVLNTRIFNVGRAEKLVDGVERRHMDSQQLRNLDEEVRTLARRQRRHGNSIDDRQPLHDTEKASLSLTGETLLPPKATPGSRLTGTPKQFLQ